MATKPPVRKLSQDLLAITVLCIPCDCSNVDCSDVLLVLGLVPPPVAYASARLPYEHTVLWRDEVKVLRLQAY